MNIFRAQKYIARYAFLSVPGVNRTITSDFSLTFGQICPTQIMNRDQFLRALRRYCRAEKLDAPVFVPGHGKGGHGRVYVGQRFTTIKSGEIGKGLHKAMLGQLGLPEDAF